MRVIEIVHGFPPELRGGTESYVEALSTGLRARGHDVLVVSGTLRWSRQLSCQESVTEGLRVLRIVRDDIYFERWDKRYHPGVSRLWHDILDREKPELVHVHHWLRLTSDIVRQAWRQHIPVILTLHDFASSCARIFRVRANLDACHSEANPEMCAACLPATPWMSERERRRAVQLYLDDFANELRLAQRVLSLSETQAEILRAFASEVAERIRVQPFLPLQRLRRSPVPPAPPPLRIASWGHHSTLKGQDVLVRAVALMRHRDQVELHLYGACDDPEFAAVLEHLAQGVRVEQHGPFDWATLESTPFHLAVLPSRCLESYGFVLDEAQMLGLPVVASDRGAYRERLGNGGELFACGDPRSLASRLDGLIEDPDRLAELRRGVRAPPPFEDNVDYLEGVYGDVLREGWRPVEDRFDAQAHLEHEFQRFDARERYALRWHDHIRTIFEADEEEPAGKRAPYLG
jgi:glycosyltransferase involved in cell wall biosynthesis